MSDELPTAVVEDARIVERRMWDALEVDVTVVDEPPRYGSGSGNAYLRLGDREQPARTRYTQTLEGDPITLSLEPRDWSAGDPVSIRLKPGVLTNPTRRSTVIDVTDAVESALYEPSLEERVDAHAEQIDALWSAVRDLEDV